MPDYEPRDISLPENAEIPDDHPGLMCLPRVLLGFCTRQDRAVTEWDCKRCFWADAALRDEHRTPGGIPFRLSCVKRHIEGPRWLAEREAQVVRLRPMMERMGPGDFEGVVKNALESALAHPDEEVAKALVRQIEAHAPLMEPEMILRDRILSVIGAITPGERDLFAWIVLALVVVAGLGLIGIVIRLESAF